MSIALLQVHFKGIFSQGIANRKPLSIFGLWDTEQKKIY